ncbi:hypothetical protein [Streptomyces coriariae]|nr:hypothetical protein [Streptomyces coriariae]
MCVRAGGEVDDGAQHTSRKRQRAGQPRARLEEVGEGGTEHSGTVLGGGA